MSSKVLSALAKLQIAQNELLEAIAEDYSEHRYMTVREYAEMTCQHPSTVTRQLTANLLPGKKISPKKWLVEVPKHGRVV